MRPVQGHEFCYSAASFIVPICSVFVGEGGWWGGCLALSQFLWGGGSVHPGLLPYFSVLEV